MTNSDLTNVVLGLLPDELDSSVSLATPLTLSRISGRDEVLRTLRQITGAFGVSDSEFVLEGDEQSVITFVGDADGHQVGLFAILGRQAGGKYSTIDLFARPWPFLAIIREKLAAENARYAEDIDLSKPYRAKGPGDGYLENAPELPPLDAAVEFHSPVLTDTVKGSDAVGQTLQAVFATMGTPSYRAVIPTADGQQLVAVYDGEVHGHTWQIALILGFSEGPQILDMRIYSRPWPVTALFRGEVYKLLKDLLGDTFWQGPAPLDALKDYKISRRAVVA